MQVEADLVSVERVAEYCDLPMEERAVDSGTGTGSRGGAPGEPASGHHEDSVCLRGGTPGSPNRGAGVLVELRNLWFRYDPTLPWTLRGLTVVIPPGSKVAGTAQGCIMMLSLWPGLSESTGN